MSEITQWQVEDFLKSIRGRETSIRAILEEFNLGTESRPHLRVILGRLTGKLIKPSGKRDGIYKVLREVKPVPVFGVERERQPPFDLKFPCDADTGMEFPFAGQVIVRGGDCILIAGQSNFGKTAMCMNILGENIDRIPIVMGNEFTKDDEPTPRFLNRLDAMDWVEWVDEEGRDKFILLPVYEDFAENIVKDRINIIDWINLPGEYYLISPVMEGIKRAVGKEGIAVIVLQKNPGVDYARGGNPSKDFADLEILIDSFSSYESRLTIGKVKESNGTVSGKSWAFAISKGVKFTNIREVVKCSNCYGYGYKKGVGKCPNCLGKGFVEKGG